MTKEELIAKAAKDAGTTKKEAASTLKSFLDSIESALVKGDKVTLIGFGTFSVKKRVAREGRNPTTGESIIIPEANIPKFKPRKKLKEAVK